MFQGSDRSHCHGARSGRPGKQSHAAALLARRASRFRRMVKLDLRLVFLLSSSSFVLAFTLVLAVENEIPLTKSRPLTRQ